MKQLLNFSLLLLGLIFHGNENDEFNKIKDEFEKGYNELNIPNLQMSYADNLNSIQDKISLSKQEQFFTAFQTKLSTFTADDLSEDDYLSYQVLLYECELNLDRISLEKQWIEGDYKVKGIKLFDESMGKDFYAYFIKKWIDKDFTPDEAYQFGLKEIENVKSKMRVIESNSNTDINTFRRALKSPKYQLTDHNEIQHRYAKLRQEVRQKAKAYFPFVSEVIEVNIVPGDNEAMAIAPAYYTNNTFYYNFFNGSYSSRDMGWIYIHEAVPGHHYQNRVMATQNESIRNLFWYPSFAEGWGAYIEQYGKELGAYPTPMDEYAQLEWDLVRSVRVSLDVALNYYGWSDEKALEFWHEHIADQDEIAEREIARMKRWPAQVITYKYGKKILDELKEGKTTPDELKTFHDQVLANGLLPLSVLKAHLTNSAK